MTNFFNQLNSEINWYLSLDKADFLGVSAFLFCTLLFICLIIWLIVKLIKSSQKPPLDISFKLEDAALESFRKKSFVTFDLYVQNTGRKQIEISRVGFVMADGSEKTFYQEPHVIKVPDRLTLAPGEEAFYDDCDLFYCLNERPPYYKKVVGLFVDIKGYPRFTKVADIPAVVNDQAIRSILTDQKGVNGF
ncbi:MAG: hypothetical protein IJI14_05860 [Anaerolineaceae bacterium]|nr:hypothetical protein [Anaerolineaceae bacterium]